MTDITHYSFSNYHHFRLTNVDLNRFFCMPSNFTCNFSILYAIKTRLSAMHILFWIAVHLWLLHTPNVHCNSIQQPTLNRTLFQPHVDFPTTRSFLSLLFSPLTYSRIAASTSYSFISFLYILSPLVHDQTHSRNPLSVVLLHFHHKWSINRPLTRLEPTLYLLELLHVVLSQN